MKYYPETEKIPDGFSTHQFSIRPLMASDFEKDYEAVMAAQELNLRWTEGRWPKDGFTLEENLEDLEYHQKMHEEEKEFTFTIMDLNEEHCLGCIYLHPLKPENIEEIKISKLHQDYVSVLYFWLRPDLTTKELEINLFDKIRNWINLEWKFNQIYYYIRGNSTADERQIFLDAGMKEKFRIEKSIFFS